MHPVAHKESGGSQSLSLLRRGEGNSGRRARMRKGRERGMRNTKYKRKRGAPQKVWCMIWSSWCFCTALLARRFTCSASCCAVFLSLSLSLSLA